MADFQWLPSTIGEENIDPRKVSTSLPEVDAPVPMNLLPPIFSKADLPFDYRFRSNPNFRLEERVDDQGNPVSEFVARSKRLMDADVDEVHVVDCEVDEVPSVYNGPIRPEDESLIEELRALFEERPVWCKNIVYSRISDRNYQKLKTALPVVSYYFHNGPWRKTWIRLGYDPRKHAEARIYQVIDFRVKKHETRGISTSTWGKLKINPRRYKVTTPQVESEESLNSEYTFTKPPAQQQTIYQVCDIDILKQLAGQFEQEYNKNCGWFTRKTLVSMRQTMKDHLATLIRQWDQNEDNENEESASQPTNIENLFGSKNDVEQDEDESSESEVFISDGEEDEEDEDSF